MDRETGEIVAILVFVIGCIALGVAGTVLVMAHAPAWWHEATLCGPTCSEVAPEKAEDCLHACVQLRQAQAK